LNYHCGSNSTALLISAVTSRVLATFSQMYHAQA
jgi:hypothetical protein